MARGFHYQHIKRGDFRHVMVFSSLVFIFLFLAIHLLVYHKVDKRYRNVVLLVSSLIFYSWGGPRYLLILLFNTFASWGFALLIERAGTPGKKSTAPMPRQPRTVPERASLLSPKICRRRSAKSRAATVVREKAP